MYPIPVLRREEVHLSIQRKHGANRPVTVLFADVVGSTRLYEKYGDSAARSDIVRCLQMLSQVVDGRDGRVVKHIGDEIMCAFRAPEQAAVAAGEMQSTLREASAVHRFSTEALRVKIGWHHGGFSLRRNDVLGEAPLIARQMVGLAKAEEILTSGASLNCLPPSLRRGAALINRIQASQGDTPLDVYAMPWGDPADLTDVGPGPDDIVRAPMKLTLEHAGRVLCVDSRNVQLRLGRARDNEIAVDSSFASRHHAELGFRGGRFRLRDNSTNGTFVIARGATNGTMRIHREEMPLPAEGLICLGLASDELTGKAIRFKHGTHGTRPVAVPHRHLPP